MSRITVHDNQGRNNVEDIEHGSGFFAMQKEYLNTKI